MPHRSLEAGRESNSTYYQRNKEKFAERNRQRNDAHRKIIREAKDVPCVDCYEKYPAHVMQFDHLRDKSFTISQITRVSSAKKLLEEIAKCDVVCANCHAERTHHRRAHAASISVPGALSVYSNPCSRIWCQELSLDAHG